MITNNMIATSILLVTGFIIGILMEASSVYLIKQRVGILSTSYFSGDLLKTLFWALSNTMFWLFLIILNGINRSTFEAMLIVSICMVLSVVDISIKKIPNELILMTFFVGCSFFITSVLASEQLLFDFKSYILGLIIGFVIFFLPALIGKGAGWGDVKYASAVGFCLGSYGILIAVIAMTVVLAVYAIYLLLSKKGNLKSSVALGPFMSVGFVFVMVSNLINTHF